MTWREERSWTGRGRLQKSQSRKWGEKGDPVSLSCSLFPGTASSRGGAAFTCEFQVVAIPGFFFFIRDFGKNAVASFWKSRN